MYLDYFIRKDYGDHYLDRLDEVVENNANQRLYHIVAGVPEDITARFWRKTFFKSSKGHKSWTGRTGNPYVRKCSL